jgi:hypothetical protein
MMQSAGQLTRIQKNPRSRNSPNHQFKKMTKKRPIFSRNYFKATAGKPPPK